MKAGADRRSADEPQAVMLLVSSLEHGGAQRQVVELYKALDRRRFAPFICSLSAHVPLAMHLGSARERDLVIVEKQWKFDLSTILRIAAVARKRRATVVHAFLFDADIAARVGGRLGLLPVVIASERNSDYSFGWLKTAMLKRTRNWFEAMIANSAAGKRFNVEAFGVAAERIHVIRNGIDVNQFRPVEAGALRARLRVPERATLVGMVASFKRQKRHGDYFRAARAVLDRHPDVYFACVGEPLRDNQQGADDYYREMRELLASLGLGGRVILAGQQDDMPAVYSACDVTVLSSSREGTPNVLLESMACGVPVVATSVADNAVIVRDGATGFLVPCGDVARIAEAIGRLVADPDLRRQMGAAARRWVVDEFSTATLARRTEAVYLTALEARRARPGRAAA
jgi:glycosyltransferase involved in cell wall biosynthesis